jgi:hypothetical protein
MKRIERQAVIRIQQYMYNEYSLEFKPKRRNEAVSEVNNIVSALVDMYDFDKLYCQSKSSIAEALSCSTTSHRNRARRFYEMLDDINFASKARRLMEQCITVIEDDYGVRPPHAKTEGFFGSSKTKEGNANCDRGGYRAFMATLAEMDEASQRHCE